MSEEIESLRQRVKELETYICNDVRDLKIELAALKQGQGKPAYWLAGTGDLYSSVAIAKQFGAAEPYIPLCVCACAPTIPEGYVMVPVEPTPGMAIAGQHCGKKIVKISSWQAVECYRAMIAAAPKGETA